MVLLCTRPLPPGLLAGNTWVMPVITCGGLLGFSSFLVGIVTFSGQLASGGQHLGHACGRLRCSWLAYL